MRVVFATILLGLIQACGGSICTDEGVDASKIVRRVVWTFWDSGEASLPAFNKYAVNHWRKLLEPSGYEIRVLNLVEGDKNNAVTVLGGKECLPRNWDTLDAIIQPYTGPDGNEVKMVPSVVRSDLIRLALLEKYGGIWMDSSNALIRPLDDIAVSSLDKSPRTVSGYVMEGYAGNNSDC